LPQIRPWNVIINNFQYVSVNTLFCVVVTVLIETSIMLDIVWNHAMRLGRRHENDTKTQIMGVGVQSSWLRAKGSFTLNSHKSPRTAEGTQFVTQTSLQTFPCASQEGWVLNAVECNSARLICIISSATLI